MAKASPIKQKVYDTIVSQALMFIFDDKNAEQFAKQAKQDPVQAMVVLTVNLLKHIKQSADAAGRGYVGNPEFMASAAKEIMAKEIHMLVAFGIVPKEEAPKVYQAALQDVVETVGGQPEQQAPQPQMPPQQPQPAGLLAQGA